MTVEVARAAAQQVLGEACGQPRLLASGRSSSAWAVGSLSGEWVVRVPIVNSGRAISYRSEARLSELLGAAGHAVAHWDVVEIGDIQCSVAPAVDGSPVDYGSDLGPELAAMLGHLLHDLHGLDVEGFGPLANDGSALRGQSDTSHDGIVDRWCQARIWPFDRNDLSEHPIVEVAPEAVRRVTRLRDQIVAAADGNVGVQHSDLHREHVLQTPDRRLAAVLDFGAAFVGSIGWDFALLHYYYGERSVERVAAGYQAAAPVEEARLLAMAVGLYKLAKNPADPVALRRIHRLLHSIESR